METRLYHPNNYEQPRRIGSDTCRLYADINGYEYPSTLFKSKRPNETNAEMYWLIPDIIIREPITVLL